MRRDGLMVWMDLEMTGLDPDKERIIEIAALITDGNLEVIEEGPSLVIHQPDALLDQMDEWNTEHHGRSGLTARVRTSTVSEEQAESEMLAFIQKHCEERTAPLAGNSIHHDRLFLRRYMPRIHNYLHYRIVDVSSVKELVKRWYPQTHRTQPPKKEDHRAMDDIRESLRELQHYRDHAFRPRS
ncbi:MAG: oligoribonuclease [Polyangiales bacterium]